LHFCSFQLSRYCWIAHESLCLAHGSPFIIVFLWSHLPSPRWLTWSQTLYGSPHLPIEKVAVVVGYAWYHI
jgi:hypothetical protein